MTFVNFRARHDGFAEDTTQLAQPIELGNFATRIEKTAKAQRLVVSFKVKVSTKSSLDAFLYVAARNDHAEPGIWAVWPPQDAGGAFTAGGHFRSHEPTTGHAIRLVDTWQRITAAIEQANKAPPFDTVIVYIVAPDGEILLARPFAL